MQTTQGTEGDARRGTRTTLRDYVQSFPRDVRQYEIAHKLGLHKTRLSHLLNGGTPTKNEVRRLRRRGIEVAA